MASGILYGVSVGPGDPELVTIKALRIIREADVVAYPQTGQGNATALGIVEEQVRGKELLPCLMPMTHDQAALDAAHERAAARICEHLAEARSVAYLCLGDVSVYASFAALRDRVRERGFETVMIPGVTSFCAAAARLQTSLCDGSERLLVATASDTDLAGVLDAPATKVLMKPGTSYAALRDALDERGLLGSTRAVRRCGYPDETVLETLPETNELGYFSVVVVGHARQDTNGR